MSGIRGRFGVRAVLGAPVLIALVAVASAAPLGAQTTPGARAPSVLNCNVSTYRLLFWPQGHKAVKSQDFPEYTVPHVELFTGTGKRYPASDSLGYVDSAGQTNHAPSCVTAAVTGTLGGPIPSDKLKTTTKATALACSAPSATVIVVPQPAKAQLSVAIPGQTAANAVMSGTASELTYNKTMCTPGKVPKK